MLPSNIGRKQKITSGLSSFFFLMHRTLNSFAHHSYSQLSAGKELDNLLSYSLAKDI